MSENKRLNPEQQIVYLMSVKILLITTMNNVWIAQSVGAVEYTDCTSADG